MRALQVDGRRTRLAQAIAEIGRIDKTIHPRFRSYPLFSAVNPGLGRV